MYKVKNIVLDFGHGGIDRNGNYTTEPNKMHDFKDGDIAYEGMLNRQIGGFLELYLNMLPNLNIITTVASNDARDLSLGYRTRVANKVKASDTIFISIHCNASISHNASGFEIFTSKGHTKSDILADNIFLSVEPLYNSVNISMRKDATDGDFDKEADFHVLRKTKCPAVLIECGFFDNKKDFDKLKNPYFQAELACKIYDGIVEYIEQ